MAKFCSECGTNTTELMRKCPNCGAKLMYSQHSANAMVRTAIIVVAIFTLMSTLLSWYNLRLSIDGGVLDAMAGIVTRIIPGFSGISTTYGITIFALALVMIITTICHKRWLTAIAACTCAVVGTMALLSPPEVVTLCNNNAESGKHLTDLFNGPLSSISPLKSGSLLTYTTILEVVTDYITVEIGNGLKIMLMLVYSAMILSIIDVVQEIRYRGKE